ncbi:hypothetical protein [Rhodohalobacter sp. 614A]|uniref:hypothetical protein n=1 Tax=Rhodohalobacter sp. 614A TaxID=2908649 RepID=UPI001F21B684|nr:hypothetical protein [Rhodohalobacter sp. 614A]
MIQSFRIKYLMAILILGIWGIAHQVHAQNSMGATSVAMGQTGVAIPNSNWSLFTNPALMSTNENRISFYGFRYVGIAEITDMAANLVSQTHWGTLGAGVHRYGFNLFSENRFLLAYKNNLDRFHYGASVSYTHVYQGGDYGTAGAIGFDAGLAAEITNDLWFGARATNLNQPSYGDTDEELPRELAAGLSYLLTPEALVTAEIVKDVMFPLSFRSGVQFEVIQSLFIRAGITTQPETYSFGFGYESNRWDVNFALQQHNPLGLSPALDLAVKF